MTGWSRGWRLALLCLLAGAALHMPSFLRSVWNADEAYVATQAQVVQEGGDLYTEAPDRKPPVVPYVYAAVFEVAGDNSLWPMRLLAVLAHAGTALLLAAEARRRWPARGDVVALVAAGLYLCAAVALFPEDTQAANFEVFMVPAMTAAFVLGARRQPLAAGLSLAVATLAKQNAATTLLPLAWDAWRDHRRARAFALLGIGFFVPVVAVALLSGLGEFAFWSLTGNAGYLDADGALGYVASNGLLATLLFAVGVAGILALLPAAWRDRKEQTDLWLWLGTSAIGVTVGLRFFGHYYLQVVPPLALLGAGAFVAASRRVRRRAVWLVAVPTTVFLIIAFVAAFTLSPDPAQEIASEVRERTDPDERIFVWGHAPEVYWRSDRLPATRFLTTGFLTGHTGGRPPDRVGTDLAVEGAWDEFEADLQSHPPALIVDVTSADIRDGRYYRPSDFPRFGDWLEAEYETVATVDGVDLWEPKAEGLAREPR